MCLATTSLNLDTAKLALYQQVVICSQIIKPAELEKKYFQGLNNSKKQSKLILSIQIMPKKNFTVFQFLTRHFQILQMEGGCPPCTSVSYD